MAGSPTAWRTAPSTSSWLVLSGSWMSRKVMPAAAQASRLRRTYSRLSTHSPTSSTASPGGRAGGDALLWAREMAARTS